MAREVGVLRSLDGLPDLAVAVAVTGLVTQLGNTWFLFAGIGVVFPSGRLRGSVTDSPVEDSLYLFALTIAASSLTVVLEHVAALPRPRGPRRRRRRRRSRRP